MAQELSIREARNYMVGDGLVDLVALIDMDEPSDWVRPTSVDEVAVGQVAYVYAMGRQRRGVVVKITKTKIHVAFTTQGALDDALRHGQTIRVQTTAANPDLTRIAPAPAAAPAAEVVEVVETPAAPVEAAPAAPAAPVTPATGSTVVEALEAVWDAITANHTELPPVVIVTGSGMIGQPRWGHFRAKGWTHRDHQVQEEGATVNLRLGEMFVAGETLAKGALHTLETMLHEAAHVLAQVRNVKDTSRQNRWHNQKFRTLAGELGLEYTKTSAHPQIGFSEVTMAPGTAEDYQQVLDALDAAIRLTVDLPAWLRSGTKGEGDEEGQSGGEYVGPHGGRKPKAEGSTSSNYVKAICDCRDEKGKPEFVIRIAKTKLAVASIECQLCSTYFHADES